MRVWVCIFLLVFTAVEIRSEDSDSGESNASENLTSSTSNLDENLRKALLKALSDLENEDRSLEVDRDQIFEKAHASSVSIFANSGSITSSSSTATPVTTTETSTATSGTEEPTTAKRYILFQQSEAVQQKTVTTIENDNDIDSEQILTSASNAFDDQFSKSAQNEKLVRINGNSISGNEKPVTTTTSAPSTATQEHEAKAEDVQFFSAPLVAAFTVHQDELGLPKAVEPIFRKLQQSHVSENDVLQEGRNLEKQTEQKQKVLEQEIHRLNIDLKQQHQINRQQQQQLSDQQQALGKQQTPNQLPSQPLLLSQRFNNNDTPFLPILSPIQNQIRVPLVQQLPNRESQSFKPESAKLKTSTVSLLPSLSFDPILEAGKLPLNGQLLPIKNAINFHAPVIHTPEFQQYRSLSNVAPQTFVNFDPVNKPLVGQFQFQPQGGRFFRQETGVGNFGGNDFRSFGIQQSFQPPPIQSSFPNRFFRSNLESTFQTPGFVNGNRFFRSNQEATFANNYFRPQEGNFNLNNLLLNSGAFPGRSEDFNIVSKVLSLNHLGGRLKRHKAPYYSPL